MILAPRISPEGSTPVVVGRQVRAVVVVNAVWALDSVALLLSGWVAPNALGYTFVVAQALVVLVLAGAQYLGRQRSEVMEAAT
jgi:hypothetical protein